MNVQGSATAELRGGGSFKSSFLYRSFLNLTVKKNMKIGFTFCQNYHANKNGLLLEAQGNIKR